MRWTGRLSVMLKRVQDSWMDLLPEVNQDDPDFQVDWADAINDAVQTGQRQPTQQEAWEAWTNRRLRRHRNLFPLGPNLFGLMFTVQADLTEQQRERLASYMTQRGILVDAYTFENLREAFIELFCAPRNSIADPSYRTSTQSQRSYVVMDYGECEGHLGYWVQDEETGEEGFIEEFDEENFWVYHEERDSFIARRTRPRMSKDKGK